MSLLSGTIKYVHPDGDAFSAVLRSASGDTINASAGTDDGVRSTRNWDAFLKLHQSRLSEGLEISCDSKDLVPIGSGRVFITELVLKDKTT